MDTFLGQEYKVVLPKIDDMVVRITSRIDKGLTPFIYVRDLSRAFRQLKICPSSYPLTGLTLDDQFWFDTSVAFGLTTGCKHCQDTTDAITHILAAHGYDLLNYLYDFFLGAILSLLGLAEAGHKALEPSTHRKWLDQTNT